MTVVNNKHNENYINRGRVLEKHSGTPQKHISEFETHAISQSSSVLLNNRNKTDNNKSSLLVLPITGTPQQEKSPNLEIVSCSTMDETNTPLLFVKQPDKCVYETVV